MTLSRKIRKAKDMLSSTFGPYWGRADDVDYVALVSDENWPLKNRWIKIYANASLLVDDERRSRSYNQRHRVLCVCGERLQMLYGWLMEYIR